MLKISDLSYKINEKILLNNISLVAEKTDIILINGESGIGKSTLLNLIAGHLTPFSGCVYFNNEEISSNKKILAPEKRNFGMVFQDFALFPHIDALSNINFGASHSENELIDLLIDELQLAQHLKKFPFELSGGQKQRVAIARAIAMKPSVLLMDEPFSNLDNKLRSMTQNLINLISNRLEVPIIIVSHDIKLIKFWVMLFNLLSKFEKGSSINKTLGFMAIALAIATLCF